MRTTLTLDPDVAARLLLLRQRSRRPLKEVVNAVMRAGFDSMDRPDMPPQTYRTPPVSLGGSLVSQVDNVHEVLSVAEGDRRA